MRDRCIASLTLLLVGAGCTAADRGGDQQAYVAKRVQDAVPQVERAVGLHFKTPPKFELRSREQVRDYVTRQLTDSQALADLTVQEIAFKQLGLIPDSVSLRALLLNVMAEQIAGYYDPKTKVLYIVQGAADDMIGLTVTHELVHALQDQYINLDSLQHIRGDDDALMAVQAVIEGQATYEQMRIMLSPDMRDVPPEMWTRMRESIRGEKSGMPVFSGAPLPIQELLLFPYLSGAQFLHDIKLQRPESTLFTSLPRSSEQILHPAAYLATPPNAPIHVTLPAPAQGRVLYDNTVGEFVTRLFLFQHLDREPTAVEGAKGWGGDRFLLVDTPKGKGVIWASVWDTAVDADEFSQALQSVVDRRYGAAVPRTVAPGAVGPIGGVSYSTKQRDLAVLSGALEGRPFVLYVDVPTGVSTRVDLSRVRFTP